VPTTSVPTHKSKSSQIDSMKAHLTWRRRTVWKPLVAMGVSLLLGVVLTLPQIFKWAFSASDLLSRIGVFCFCLGFVFFCAFVHIWSLDTQDLSALLESDSITAIPVMAEYFNYFTGVPQPKQKAKAHALREHIVALLRSQGETPQIEFAGSKIYWLIQVLEVAQDQGDRRLLLNAVAQSGTSACFGSLDEMVRKVCTWELKDDERAKHALRAMVIECKNTIRGRSAGVKEAQSLLRASEASDGLLHPSSPPRPQDNGENLLRATVQQDHQDSKIR